MSVLQMNPRWAALLLLALSLNAVPSAPLNAAEAADGLTPQQLSRARILYFQCRACHTLTREEGHKVGPSLAGIFGREAGTIEDFAGYSLALRESALVWDRDTMDEWLRSPASLVPGNIMAYLGLANEGDRALLIRYLEIATSEDDASP